MCAIAMYPEGSTFATCHLGVGPLLQALENTVFCLFVCFLKDSTICYSFTWACGALAFLTPSGFAYRGRLKEVGVCVSA